MTFQNLTLSGDPKILEALKQAAQLRPSAQEIQEQRVSFVYSAMSEKSGVTRDHVRQLVTAHDAGATLPR